MKTIKSPEEILRDPKFNGLSNLVLICEAIEAYHAQFEEGWVSVKDKPPSEFLKKDQECWVVGWQMGRNNARYKFSNKFGHCFGIFGSGLTYNVTHYIEINLPPSPPKE
jgi:hypothetical protein